MTRIFTRIILSILGITYLIAAPQLHNGNVQTTPEFALAATTTVTISNFAFTPQTVNIRTGDTVTWVNHDPTAHTVTSTNNGPLNSGNIASGASFNHTFTSAGSFNYHCTIHPAMTGTVVVANAATATPTATPQATSATPQPTTTPASTATPITMTPAPTATAKATASATASATAIPSPKPTTTPAPSPTPPPQLPATGPENSLELVGSLAILSFGTSLYWQLKKHRKK